MGHRCHRGQGATLLRQKCEIDRPLYSTDERFDRVFHPLEGEVEKPQRIFFAGQMFDAFSLLADLVGRAEREISLVDGYVDVHTLNILAKKHKGVAVTVYTSGNRLTQGDVDVFNAQYPQLTVRRTRTFHDHFLILDSATAYHIGASLKDAGKKCFGIDLIQDEELTKMLIEKLKLLEERQPTGLALHRRVPHMTGANWNQKTMPVVFLEQREHPVVPGLCWRHSVCSSLVPWLIRRIQPVFIVLCWEELFQLPQIIE